MGGTLVIRLERMSISMLDWTMVTLMLNGATSYARLCRPHMVSNMHSLRE